MKLILRIGVMCILLYSIYACTDDEGSATGQLVLDFRALYDGNPLELNTIVDYGGAAMRLKTSEFYIGEITLNSPDGDVMLSRIDYINFTDAQGQAWDELVFDDVPTDRVYTGLAFHIGVPADLNKLTPNDFSSSEVLSNTSTYWDNWKSYIFSQLEGQLDTAGSGKTDLTFLYHSGKDDLYTPVHIAFDQQLNLASGMSSVITLNVEHKTLFTRSNGGLLDIKARPTAHNAQDLEYPTIIMANFQYGISLE